MRITRDAELTAMELSRALKKTGFSLVRDLGRSVERPVDPIRKLAEALTMEVKPDDDRVSLDPPRVTRDEAVALCIHHLELAATYFEATPDDGAEAIRDQIRKGTAAGAGRGPAVCDAVMAFINSLDDYYESLKKED